MAGDASRLHHGRRLKYTKYRVDNCHPLCGLNPRNVPAGFADLSHKWIEAGNSVKALQEMSDEFGHHVSAGTFDIHRRKHLVKEIALTPIEQLGGDPELDEDKKLSDLEILDRIIQAGAKGLHGRSVRISPEMTLKAMELRLKMTNGGVFDDLMAAVAKAMSGEPDPPERNPAALSSDDEQAQAGPDDDV